MQEAIKSQVIAENANDGQLRARSLLHDPDQKREAAESIGHGRFPAHASPLARAKPFGTGRAAARREGNHDKLALEVSRRKLQESWSNQYVGYFVGNIRTFTLYIASADDWESYQKVRATASLGSTVRSGKLADVGEDNVVLANLQFLDHPHIRESYGNVSYAQKGVYRM